MRHGITEEALAAAFNVSRTTIRQVIARLAQDGILVKLPIYIDISMRIEKLPPPRAVAGPFAIPPIKSRTLIEMCCNGSRKNYCFRSK
jgi:DNA-binding Lrp family transcriptional regulator